MSWRGQPGVTESNYLLFLASLFVTTLNLMRIVSLAPSNTEILYSLGLEDKIVGVTAFCDYPEEARAKPKIGDWAHSHVENILALKPDLVFTSSIVQEASKEVFKNLPFRHVHLDPRNLEEVFESIRTIGEATEVLIVTMRNQIDGLVKTVYPSTNVPRVYIEEWHQPPMISGNWVPDMVRLAGGKYGLMNKGEVSRVVTTEEITAYDPEIAILSLCGYGERPKPELIITRPGWEDISAVRNRRVYVVNDTFLNRPGPRLVEGLRRLIRIIQQPSA